MENTTNKFILSSKKWKITSGSNLIPLKDKDGKLDKIFEMLKNENVEICSSFENKRVYINLRAEILDIIFENGNLNLDFPFIDNVFVELFSPELQWKYNPDTKSGKNLIKKARFARQKELTISARKTVDISTPHGEFAKKNNDSPLEKINVHARRTNINLKYMKKLETINLQLDKYVSKGWFWKNGAIKLVGCPAIKTIDLTKCEPEAIANFALELDHCSNCKVRIPYKALALIKEIDIGKDRKNVLDISVYPKEKESDYIPWATKKLLVDFSKYENQDGILEIDTDTIKQKLQIMWENRTTVSKTDNEEVAKIKPIEETKTR